MVSSQIDYLFEVQRGNQVEIARRCVDMLARTEKTTGPQLSATRRISAIVPEIVNPLKGQYTIAHLRFFSTCCSHFPDEMNAVPSTE